MASKLKLTELLYPTSTTAAITINSDDSVTIPTQSTTNLAYTGTLTGGTGVVNLGSGQFYKDASGNVGIGTSSPASNAGFGGLTLNGTSGSLFDLRVANTLTFRVGTTSTENLLQGISNVPMTFYTNNSERMRINSSGNVGIGTVSPGGRLEVVGGRTFLAAASETFACGVRYVSTGGAFYFGASDGTATPDGVFCQAGGSERMRITDAGNLLVGTTTVNGRISSVPKSGFAPAITAGTWATAAGVSSSGSFGGGFSWIDGSGGYCAWVDDSGTDFNIAGATTSNAVANGVFLNGYAATSWSARSDERLKQNLQPITDALNKTCSLRAVTGAYKNFPDEQQAFLLAQDVQKVLPEAVCVADKRSPEQYLGLAYTQVIPLLVAAIQELKAEVDALKGAA